MQRLSVDNVLDELGFASCIGESVVPDSFGQVLFQIGICGSRIGVFPQSIAEHHMLSFPDRTEFAHVNMHYSGFSRGRTKEEMVGLSLPQHKPQGFEAATVRGLF